MSRSAPQRVRSQRWYPRGADEVIRDDLDTIVVASRPLLDRLSGKAVLITGGGGFVGRYLVESILHHASMRGPGCQLGLVTRQPDHLRERYAEEVRDGSVLVLGWADPEVRGAAPGRWDLVVHAAAPADPARYLEDPYGALRDTVKAASDAVEVARSSRSERLLIVSSGAVYGRQPRHMAELPETFPGAPDISEASSCYGEGKRLAELLGLLSGVDCRVARLFSLLGPYQDMAGSFAAPSIIRQAAVDGEIRLSSDGTVMRNYCYASDVTIALLALLLGSPEMRTYNVGNREGTVTIADVAAAVSRIFGGVPVVLGDTEAGLAAASRYVPALDRMYADPAITAPRVGVEEGLRRVCQSLHARGLIPRGPGRAPAEA